MLSSKELLHVCEVTNQGLLYAKANNPMPFRVLNCNSVNGHDDFVIAFLAEILQDFIWIVKCELARESEIPPHDRARGKSEREKGREREKPVLVFCSPPAL